MQQNSGIPADVKDRIISTANALYEQSGHQSMPTVDQVRRAAKVDMNAASQVMREWRRAQTAQSTPVVVNIPELVQTASTNAVIAIWQQAQELANENLKNAQGAWEQERQELDAMRAELAEAFEAQAAELEQVKAQLAQANDLAANQAKELVQLKEQYQGAITQSEKAEIKLNEIERNANTLRLERDEAVKGTQAAREKAAKLEGALEAVQAQNKDLLDAIGRAEKGKK
jgi:colicin import membrane protein